MLIELCHGSKLFENISEDRIGGKQYIQNKRYQLDQMILYARTDQLPRSRWYASISGNVLIAIIAAISVTFVIQVFLMSIIHLSKKLPVVEIRSRHTSIG